MKLHENGAPSPTTERAHVTNSHPHSTATMSRQQHVATLTAALDGIPESWLLLPVDGKKAPIGKGWQCNGLPKSEFIAKLPRISQCKAVGVLAGEVSGGLVLVDHDGASCDALIESLAGCPISDALPPTVGWTSGKPGRYQLVYRVPKEHWGDIERRDRKTGSIGPDGKAEALDLRWGKASKGFQSVIVGAHPETEGYAWLPGRSPNEIDVAMAPQWLIDAMKPEPKTEPPIKAKATKTKVPNAKKPTAEGSAVPLANCLAPQSREYLDGVGEGDRNNSMAALARDLIGTALYLQGKNRCCGDDPETLFLTACDACSQSLPRSEAATIWASAIADNPGPTLDESKIDNNIKHWERAQRKAATETDTTKAHFETSLEGGLIWVTFKASDDGGQRQVRKRVGDHIEAIGYVNSPTGDGAGVLVEFKTQRAGIGRLTIARRGLGGEATDAIGELMARGYGFTHSQLLRPYLLSLGSDLELTEYTVTDRTGWTDNNFVLQHQTIGDPLVRFQDVEPPTNPDFTVEGTLESWQRSVGEMAQGNSRLLLAAGAAFAAVLLKPLEIEPGGFHLFGTTSIGKSTALTVAISITGERQFASWNTTANGLESKAEAHNDLLLTLDEIQQATPKAVSEISYQVANGLGKSRMAKTTAARKTKEWRTLVLSTGEKPIGDYLKEGDIRQKGGQETRIPDVPALPTDSAYGLFETIHNRPLAGDFAIEIKESGSQNRGTPLIAFLERLVLTQSDVAWVDRQQQRLKAIASKLTEGTSDSAVGRTARRFALVQLALELAMEWGILTGPPSQPEWAIGTCFGDWLEARGGDGSIEIKRACQRIEHLFVTEEHGDRIRRDDAGPDDRTRNLLAYKVGLDFLVPPAVFQTEFIQGVDRDTLIKELQKRGWMAPPDSQGKNAHSRHLGAGLARTRCYVFSKFWSEGSDNSESVKAEW
jgi:hypothetical protein